ncbi:imidazolonepropionase [Neptunomonas sp.]|uniref:imidazolonepropionase n=1 Tax=Neptunomonas sp. TaxID=1971898 RepID=UPI0035672E20
MNDFRDADKVWLDLNLATMSSAVGSDTSSGISSGMSSNMSPATYGIQQSMALAVKNGRISAIAPMAVVDEPLLPTAGIAGRGGWMTPGLIDCHTHLVFAGSRAEEFEQRLQGVPYAQIAREGGGILSTVRATRAASEQQLFDLAVPRLQALMREGVTTLEIKSGYGLTLKDELKMLRVARRLGDAFPVQVCTTLLGAHALPPEFSPEFASELSKDRDAYIDLVCQQMIPAAAEQKLADAVDVFCEGIGFSVAQCDRVFKAAQNHGLAIKGHTEQLSDLKGSQLAASYGALSVDHLEYLDASALQPLVENGTVAVLLPGAFYFLRETQRPPIQALRDAGIPMAIATDFNPGTSPLASLRLMMNMACTLFRLTPEEALAGVTCNAAQALGLSDDTGKLVVGAPADMLLWDIQHPSELAYQIGVPMLKQRIYQGVASDV